MGKTKTEDGWSVTQNDVLINLIRPYKLCECLKMNKTCKDARYCIVHCITCFLFVCFMNGIAFAQDIEFARGGVPNVSAKIDLDTSRRIEMTCGGTRVQLICGYNENFRQIDDRVCNNNTLIFGLENGQVERFESEGSLEPGATPIGVSCSRDLTHSYKSNLIRVTFLSGSYNCNKCWQDLIFFPTGRPALPKRLYQKNYDNNYQNTIFIESRSRQYPDDYLYEEDLK